MMASSKKSLKEQEQIVEGVFEKILNAILKRKTKKVLDLFKDNPALKDATQDVIDSHTKLQDKLRKKYGYKKVVFK